MVENTSILYVYPNLPNFMSILLNEKYLTNLYYSLIIKQLIELGISSLAQTAACQNLLLSILSSSSKWMGETLDCVSFFPFLTETHIRDNVGKKLVPCSKKISVGLLLATQ